MIFPCERCGWMPADCTCRWHAVVPSRRPPVERTKPRPRSVARQQALSPELAQEIWALVQERMAA